MIEQSVLDHSFDEESVEFGEPAARARREVGPVERLGQVVLAGGVISLVVQIFVGTWAGSWLGFASAYGGMVVGAAVMFVGRYRGTTPGIKHDGVQFDTMTSRGVGGWIAALGLTGLYVALYWAPGLLGHGTGAGGGPGGLVLTVDPLARVLTGGAASQWFLYGTLYCLAMVVFGVRMLMKYRHNRYQKIRTVSVVVAQVGFAFVLANVLVLFQLPYYEFNGVWPLKYDTLWPEKVSALWAADAPHGAFGVFLVFWTAVVAVLGVPVLTYFYGKRWYCSWVCGCGGLAETLGDGYRQLSDKSTRAWKIERWLIHSVLVLVVLATAALWLEWPGAHGFKKAYGFVIGAAFSGVVGVGFYPLMGSRVWCRFGCPQAAILGLLQRYASRFRITTNGSQCMSCGNCSTYCEMGIDVRAYAQQGKNIVRASCVGCGVCSAVCPRGVLKLENGKGAGDRYSGADAPLAQFLEDLREPPRP